MEKEKLDAKTRSIGFLLSQDFFFRIPDYQRPFSWDSEHFEDLINDITDANKDQEYFLGTFVLHHRKDLNLYDVVDGQQRLTSVLILLACLRDLVTDLEFKSDIQNKILQKKNVVDGIPEKIRLEVKDLELFSSIVIKEEGTLQDLDPANLPEPEWRYVDAVNIFRDKLVDLDQSEIQRIITFISQKCIVVYLSASAFDDAFRLFTIVNDRGKLLRRIDILKAINIAPDAISKETVRSRIAQKWEQVEKDLGESTFERVFHLVRLILLKDKPQEDLLKEFEERVFKKKIVAKGEPFFNLIFKYANLFTSVFEDRDFVPTNATEYNKYRALIHIMDAEFKASEWRACLLYFAKQFGAERFFDFCLLMEKVYLAQWVQGVRKDERFSEYSKILGLIESAKKPADVFAGISYDVSAISTAIGRPNVYSSGFCKYLLLRLEVAVAEHDRVHEFNAKSIEHVLPQEPDPTGYWAGHHDLSKIKDYVDSIGNLVLLSKSKNSAARNFDFDKKKTKYLENRVSDYPRSIQVLDYADWERPTIDKRTKEAQKLIIANF